MPVFSLKSTRALFLLPCAGFLLCLYLCHIQLLLVIPTIAEYRNQSAGEYAVTCPSISKCARWGEPHGLKAMEQIEAGDMDVNKDTDIAGILQSGTSMTSSTGVLSAKRKHDVQKGTTESESLNVLWNSTESSAGLTPSHPACTKLWENPYSDEKGWKQFHMVLRRYKEFHSEQLSCLRRNKSGDVNDTLTCKTPVRTLTWACEKAQFCSGIGDQLGRIQMSFLLALATDRVFVIYWNPEDTHTMQYLQPNEINWKSFNTSLGMHTDIHLKRPTVIRKSKHYTELLSLLQQSEEHMTTSQELQVPFIRAYRGAVSSRPAREVLQSLGLLDILRPELGKAPLPHLSGTILRYLFGFDSQIIEEVTRLEKKLGLFSESYAALHLRTGFYGTDFEEIGSFNPNKIVKDKRKWTHMIECTLNGTNTLLRSTALLYLASDSYTVKQWAAETYSSRVRIANVTLQHVALEESWGERDHIKIETERSGYKDAWVDFLLLAHSHLLARGISGFSTAAGNFCSLPLSQQISLLAS